MILNIFLLILGMVLLIKGADWFVSGSSNIAKALKVPSLVIGLTLVSLGTSAPEASVSINSAISGMNDLSLGNIIGSNIFNTLLILGLSSAIAPLIINRDVKRFDIPIMLGIYVLLILFSFVITPYKIDIVESIVLLVLFIGYMVFLVLRAKRSKDMLSAPSAAPQDSLSENEPASMQETAADKNSSPKKEKKKMPIWLAVILAAAGLACVIFGGTIVVGSASEIAKRLGMSETLIGLTIVAVGTSLPELVTSVVAAVKKETDIAVGNVIGSNILNVIFILGLSSAINPLTLDISILVDMLVMLGSGLIIAAVSLLSKKTARWQGIAMSLMYAAYLAYIIVRN